MIMNELIQLKFALMLFIYF